jgi:hypothetical protein
MLASFLLAAALAGGCLPSASGPQSDGPRSDEASALPAESLFDSGVSRISGPYAHENLAVFLLHADKQDGQEYLTLDSGLSRGLVAVTEREQEQVGELLLENRSDYPLFLQEGERLQGGKQDRTIIASLVIPAHSGKVAVPSACVEQSRWQEGSRGRGFAFASNAALAPKGVRASGKVEGSQGDVWRCVQGYKDSTANTLSAANTNSSVNETLDSPQVQKLCEDYARALAAPLKGHGDVVGVALAVNGRLEEVDVYPNHALLEKMYPRLIQSYALQAALLKGKGKAAETLSRDDVGRFLRVGGTRKGRDRQLGNDNTLSVYELEGDRFQCVTRRGGAVVHSQVLQRVGGDGGDDRAKVLRSDW